MNRIVFEFWFWRMWIYEINVWLFRFDRGYFFASYSIAFFHPYFFPRWVPPPQPHPLRFSSEILAWICKSLFSDWMHSKPKTNLENRIAPHVTLLTHPATRNWFISPPYYTDPCTHFHEAVDLPTPASKYIQYSSNRSPFNIKLIVITY